MQYSNPKKVRKIPKQIGNAAKEALNKFNQAGGGNDIWVQKLKAIDLCYSNGKTGEEIAEELGGLSTQTVSSWFSEIVGVYCQENDEQAIARAVSIIEGRTSACFSFEDAYWESTRCMYVDGIGSHPSKDESTEDKQVKQGRKEFRSIMLRAGINLACFVGRDGKLHFNEDGKTLAINALNNRTLRKEEDQDSEIFEVYQNIRAGYFPAKHNLHYEWMLEKACSNLRDLNKAYPDFILHNEEDIREEFWRNTCMRNNGFDAFPGMSYLGELPWQLLQGWFFIFEDVLYLDPLIVKEFSNSKSWDYEETTKRKDRWKTYLLAVLMIRCYEHNKFINEFNQFSAEEQKDFKWLIDYLFCYENKLEDEYESAGISLAKEEKWASREIAEDKRLRANFEAMKSNIKKTNLNEKSDAIKAARICLEWAPKAKKITPRLSVGEAIECANMLLDSEQNKGIECVPDAR